ncbi:ABC transporter ATP-binding protein [Pediococcus acidilactici]|nr:ABC transporter ATP-binding protein [Pediococcus acidilactici]KAF0537262.1 ABC transporter ATP-binding protein [Pediococcus acidilactici]KAF0544047.1 ABC transporter ATP-binding protein [Pediococcus acidilactici]
MVNTILKETDLFCPNSVRINFTIYRLLKFFSWNLIPYLLNHRREVIQE